MMLKVLPLTALALGLSSGAAFADRGHGDDHRGGNEHRAPATTVVRDHRAGGNTVVVRDRGVHGNNVVVRNEPRFHGNTVVVRDRGWNGGGRVVVRNEPRFRGGVARRPIYVSRPVIGHRYYNYYRRPALIVESYGAMPGYYWVAGSWSWNGYEWIWAPGHYEPDAGYGYYDGY